MTPELTILLWTAATIGFVHTAIGPDHYLPFVMMARTGRWSITKTAVVTLLCGIGHIASSVILGFAGIALGVAVSKLVAIESLRAELSAWLLIAFGFIYLVWGVRRALRVRPHEHTHIHDDDGHHSHLHSHTGAHMHVHPDSSLTPWVLFTIFILGPCEPLIPLLMYPAAKQSLVSVTLVVVAFGTTTMLTMLGITLASVLGLTRLNLNRAQRYSHALAGLAIFLCGGAIKWLGL